MVHQFNTNKDFIIIEVTREDDIDALDLTKIEKVLKKLRRAPGKYQDTVHILFGGFDDDPKEIFEIKSIREWVGILIDTYPEILFFLEERLNGLQNILLCISDYSAVKQLPNAVFTNPILDNKVLVRASIPEERFDRVIYSLAANPLAVKHKPFLTDTYTRLKQFAQ